MKINIEQLYWFLEFGPSKRKLSLDEIRSHFKNIKKPVFFLSTGRCGTKWFAYLLKKDTAIKVFHAPQNDMAMQNRLAYQIQKKYNTSENSDLKAALNEVFLAGRAQYLRYSYKTDKRYFETNNHITFFAPLIAELLPESLFVHIVRHPVEFVKSGIARNWYNPKVINRQIEPVDSNLISNWQNQTSVEKICWLWNETNSFIEDFKTSIPKERHYTFDFNSLTLYELIALTEFLNVNISKQQILKQLPKKINKNISNKTHSSQNISELNQKIMSLTSHLANAYGYR